MDDFGKTSDKHDLQYISVDRIVPNSWNANEEDEVTFDLLVSDVSETGFIDSLTVVPLEDGTYRIIGGEHRWRAAKAAGEDSIPCLILSGQKWRDEDLQKFVTVRMNMIRGKLNPEKFLKLYNEMAEKYGANELQKLFGFADKKAFKKVIHGVTKAAKQALPKELHAELEERAKDAKTVEDLGKIVQELFARHGDTVPLGYMIFTHGKQEHVYIAMSNTMRKAMDKVLLYCDTTKTEINEFMEPVMRACLKDAMQRLDKVESTTEEKNPFD